MDARRYRIEEVLGKGGYGVVYRATMEADGGFSRPVALKRLQRADPEGLARFRDEARLLSHVRHSAVIHVDALLELDGLWTVVMEYVDGVDLYDLLQAYILPPRAALELVAVLARALDAAWSTEVDGRPLHLVHRDIKPSNIRLTAHGDVKLLDFGIATAAFAREVQTQQGVSLGTPAYMAPERLAGGGGSAADVYALGLCLAECLGGQRSLYLGYCDQAAFVEQVGTLVAQLPNPVRGLVTEMVSFDEGLRPSVGEVARRCDALADEIGGASLLSWATASVPEIPRPVPNRDDPWVGRHLTEGTRMGATPRRWVVRGLLALVALAGLSAVALGGLTALGGAAWWVARRPGLPERGQAALSYRTESGDIGREVTSSHDGRWIAFGVGDQVFLEDVDTGRRRQVARHVPGLKFNLELAPDGRRLALSTLTHVFVVDVATDDHVRELQPYRSYTLGWAPDGQRLLMTRDEPGNVSDSHLFVLDLATGERQIVHRGSVEHAAWWPDGGGLFVWPEGGPPYRWRADGTRLGDLPDDFPKGAPTPEGSWVWTEKVSDGTLFREATLSADGVLGTVRVVASVPEGLRSWALSSRGWYGVISEPGRTLQRARLGEPDAPALVEQGWGVAPDVSDVSLSVSGARAVRRGEEVWVQGLEPSEGWTWVHLLGFVDDDVVALAGERGGVDGVWRLGPEGLELVHASDVLQAGAVDGRGRIWGRTGEMLVVVSADGLQRHGSMPLSDLNVVAANPSGTRLAVKNLERGEHGREEVLYVVDTATGDVLATWHQPVIGLVWEDDDTLLGSFDQSLFRFHHGGGLTRAGYSPVVMREVADLELAPDGTVWMLGERNGDLVELRFAEAQ